MERVSRNLGSICRAAVVAVGSLLLTAGASSAYANTIAADNAGNAQYNDGWQTGDNGGFGFGAWTLNGSSNSGEFLYTAQDNGSFATAAGNQTIDTAGRSWGLYANSGALADAVRSITNPLHVGYTFSIGMDNGYINNGGVVGFGLRDSSGNNRFEFYFKGGQSTYDINDGIGEHATAIGFTDTGLDLSLTLTSINSYSLTVTPLGGSSTVYSGMLGGTGGSAISQLRVFNYNAGGGDNYNAYFNSAAVAVPLPSAALMGLAGTGGMLILQLARKRLVKAVV